MSERKIFSPDKDEFIEVYDKLGSFEEVAKFYNVGKSVVARYSKKIGYVNNKRKDISWNPPSEKEFVEKYLELKSKNRMAEYYNVCDKTILKYAQKIGFVNQYRVKLTDTEIQYILDNYQKRKSIDLAQELGVSRSLVTKVWRENGMRGKKKRTYYINEDYFEVINTPDKAYFLGIIASDGCVYTPQSINKMSSLNFQFHIQEEEIIYSFLKYTNATYKAFISNNRIKLQINSDKMVADLSKYNIVERKTWSFIPPLLCEELMWHFIRGYFDGDGSIYQTGKNVPCNWFVQVCGNEQTIKFFNDFFTTKGIESKVHKDNRKDKYQFDFYYIRIRKRNEKDKLLSLLYEDSEGIRLNRKYNKYLEYIKVCNETPS